MKKILKILNPFIFLINLINYMVHLEMYARVIKYESYDFKRDIKYF